jgi:hypothetical protein
VQIPDLINGLFEAGGSVVLWLNVRQSYRDKEIKGVHLAPVVFWALWGGWNLWYYPYLSQWFSFIAGINVLLANAAWVWMMVHYEYGWVYLMRRIVRGSASTATIQDK